MQPEHVPLCARRGQPPGVRILLSTVWKNADYRRTHDQGDKQSYIISIKNNYVFVNISTDLLLAFKSQSCTCLHQKTVLHHFVQFQNLSSLVADKR